MNDSSEASTVLASMSKFKPMVKLAPLEIPNFTGIYSEWSAFHDIFCALVHQNSSLTDIQKFFYLRSSVSGDAQKTIHFLDTTSDNYKIAWDALISRYSNKKLAVQLHTKKLFDLENINNESSTELRKLVDAINGHIKALASLGQNPKEWGSLLLHLISIKLDASTLRQWEIESSKSEVASVNKLLEYLENRCQILEAIEASGGLKIVQPQQRQSQKNSFKFKKSSDQSSSFIVTGTLKCYNCDGAHTIYKCPALLAFSISDRIKRISELKLCKICLRSHIGEKCTSRRCAKCMKAHNSLLHLPKSKSSMAGGSENATASLITSTAANESKEKNVSNLESISAHSSQQSSNKQMLLSTAVVIMRNARGESTACRVLLDSGSQSNFMSESISQTLRLNKTRVSCTIIGINESAHNASYMTSANIESRVSNYKVNIDFYILPRLTGNIPLSKIDVSRFQIPSEFKLADPSYSEPQRIDAILGSEVFYGLLPGSTQAREDINKASTVALCTSLSKLEEQVSKFWHTEEVGSKTAFTLEEKACREHFENTVQRDEQGRFVVQQPFRDKMKKLGDSKPTATRRFHAIEKRLLSSPRLKIEYSKFMKEYEDLEHMTRVKQCSNIKENYYLPHHAVWREDSVTTKLRVVFDASCKTTSGVSLNDVLLKGPCIQEDLINLLTRFRKHRYAMTADISKMYRRIWVAPNHRTYQQIVWRPDPDQELQQFQLNTITYGTVPASFLATACLHRLADEESNSYPDACNAIKQDFYMDDNLGGADSLQEAITLRDNIIGVLLKGGFDLRKWTASDPELLTGLANKENDPTLILDLSENSAKILGLRWDPSGDVFKYEVKLSERKTIVTKRQILTEIATIFDPLGLISLVVIKAKIKMQRLWAMGIGWDETLPEETMLDWYKFRESLLLLNNLSIPRCIVIIGEIIDVQIHGFSDASIEAFGACLYLITTNNQGKRCSRLICAKSRVAPLKSISLPRLELCGAVLLARLADKIIAKLKMNISQRTFWTDSSIVLAWISSPSAQWKTFVAHRVGEIQEITSIFEWAHVDTKDNPADIISRGRDPQMILNDSFWWEGPNWLQCNSSKWPHINKNPINFSTVEERRTISLITSEQPKLPFLSRYSTWSRLLRVVSLCLRFIYNTAHPDDKKTGPLLPYDLNNAINRVI
ncbi:uncharacterized protein LOC111028196 [Myzus persicae]|uniref:uncharacterized protein LOC111028196 n=1 Tax=Myzus persicae TaxID=13164 RepID=UPI000B9335F5|nr:uncharacterized protein LOC111028196 [Myzus persicae]